jgi:hypothetical protein
VGWVPGGGGAAHVNDKKCSCYMVFGR